MTDSTDAPSYPGRELVDNASLWEAVRAGLPNFTLIRELVAQAYSAETGIQGAGIKEIASWFRRAMRENPEFQGLTVDETFLRYIMLPDLAAKFEYMMQRPCLLCLPYQKVDYIRFPLHTSPVSRQVDRQKAFKEDVKDYLGRVHHDFADFFEARLCIAVTFVLRNQGRIPDVDNLTKTLLDALQGYAYKNDSQVDHLDLIRLSSGSDDSFIGIRIAVTEIASNLDVIRPEFDVQWIGRAGVGLIGGPPRTPTASSAETS